MILLAHQLHTQVLRTHHFLVPHQLLKPHQLLRPHQQSLKRLVKRSNADTARHARIRTQLATSCMITLRPRIPRIKRRTSLLVITRWGLRTKRTTTWRRSRPTQFITKMIEARRRKRVKNRSSYASRIASAKSPIAVSSTAPMIINRRPISRQRFLSSRTRPCRLSTRSCQCLDHLIHSIMVVPSLLTGSLTRSLQRSILATVTHYLTPCLLIPQWDNRQIVTKTHLRHNLKYPSRCICLNLKQ